MTTQVNPRERAHHVYSDYLIHPVACDACSPEQFQKQQLTSSEVVISTRKTADSLMREIFLVAASCAPVKEVYLLYPLSVYRQKEEKVCITPFVQTLSQLLKSADDALTLWAYLRSYDLCSTQPLEFRSDQNIMRVYASGSIVLHINGETHRVRANSPESYAQLLELLAKR